MHEIIGHVSYCLQIAEIFSCLLLLFPYFDNILGYIALYLKYFRRI